MKSRKSVISHNTLMYWWLLVAIDILLPCCHYYPLFATATTATDITVTTALLDYRMEEVTVLISLPESLSPTSNVRRSCSQLMTNTQDNGDNIHNKKRSVTINSTALLNLAKKITQSIIHDKEKDSSSFTSSSLSIDKCMNDINFANWDAAGWHYTGSNYSRPNLSKEQENKQRFERVALYVMVMDCINFCFWPVDNVDNDNIENDNTCHTSRRSKENLLEYEHLAIALKELAEADDIIDNSNNNDTNKNFNNMDETGNDNLDPKSSMVQAEDSYAFAPQNLINLDVSQLLTMIKLPSSSSSSSSSIENAIYQIPNPKERTRLIIELAQSLLIFHHGSATHFISKANKSSDMLVFLILQYFPGFRDTAVHNGRMIAFYKRAQILVADLWAALGNSSSSSGSSSGSVSCDSSSTRSDDYCNFHDIEKITTFADYRVPQLLRHLQVLIYSPTLSKQIDQKIELVPFCDDEIYIRAATVVAVDELVNEVKSMLLETDVNSKKYIEEVNAVKMDWYLWNIGEKMDRKKEIENHHRVLTIFY